MTARPGFSSFPESREAESQREVHEHTAGGERGVGRKGLRRWVVDARLAFSSLIQETEGMGVPGHLFFLGQPLSGGILTWNVAFHPACNGKGVRACVCVIGSKGTVTDWMFDASPVLTLKFFTLT